MLRRLPLRLRLTLLRSDALFLSVLLRERAVAAEATSPPPMLPPVVALALEAMPPPVPGRPTYEAGRDCDIVLLVVLLLFRLLFATAPLLPPLAPMPLPETAGPSRMIELPRWLMSHSSVNRVGRVATGAIMWFV